MCGTRGAVFTQAGPDSIHDLRYADFPAAGALRIGGRRRIGESRDDAANRNAADFVKRWHGVPCGTGHRPEERVRHVRALHE